MEDLNKECDNVDIYVKKLWSLSPDEYEYIGYIEAMGKYNQYLVACEKYGEDYPKTFKVWVETEI